MSRWFPGNHFGKGCITTIEIDFIHVDILESIICLVIHENLILDTKIMSLCVLEGKILTFAHLAAAILKSKMAAICKILQLHMEFPDFSDHYNWFRDYYRALCYARTGI